MQTHDINVFDELNETNLAPSFNVAPQSFQPLVRLKGETGKNELTVMRWGLVPYWSKDGKAFFSTINAKSETGCHQSRIPRSVEIPPLSRSSLLVL